MGITYRIDVEGGVTYVLFDGEVTDADFVTHTERLIANPAWPPHRKLHLTDVTSQKNPKLLSAGIIRQMARLWASHRELIAGLRVAVVAGGAFDNAEVFERAISGSGLTLIVFNLLPTACTWLGINPGKAAQVFDEMRAEARG